MAQDNAAQALKDLQKVLADLDMKLLATTNDMDKYFARLQTSITEIAKQSNVTIDQMFSHILKRVKATDATKIKLQFDFAGMKSDLEQKMKILGDAINTGKTKVNLFGDTISGKKNIVAAFAEVQKQFEQFASLSKKTTAQLYEDLMKVMNLAAGIGTRASSSSQTRQRVRDQKEVEKIEQNLTESLQRRVELEKLLSKYKPDSRAKDARAYREELDSLNKSIQQNVARLGSLGLAGTRALKGYETAGLIVSNDKAQLEAERNYINLLKERNQLEEKSARLRLQLSNAQYAGKASSEFVARSEAQLVDNAGKIAALTKQINETRVSLTAEAEHKIEQNELAHQNAMTTIVNNGEQARLRVEERKKKESLNVEQKALNEYKKLYSEREKLYNDSIKLEAKENVGTLTTNESKLLSQYRSRLMQISAEMSRLAQSSKLVRDYQNEIYDKGKQELADKKRSVALEKEITKEKNSQQKAAALYSKMYAKAEQAQHRHNLLLKKQKIEWNNILSAVRRVGSAMGIYFSARGLVQFARKLVETRGEFEMQFVAMKQIIGDADAATKIWGETMQQALKSPFKAMQLVTYTKQLAAYRIETEKLFDTTKRLADVSAGLGVDMGRLILAYGQVKAANYLRASEVRQFTEAGVNIAGNLAKYFTEMEGRAVGTAEVMERITKRMVLFSDVEAIFKRMTDEGGEFFNMQEIQADTVKGQLMKLQDAYDQMLNTIGQSNQGTIREFLDKLNQMTRNWRDVAALIMKNVYALSVLIPVIISYRKGAELAASKSYTWGMMMNRLKFSLVGLKGDLQGASAGMLKYRLSVIAGTTAMRLFTGAVNLAKTALKTFVPILAIEGVLWFINKLQSANRELENLRAELSDFASENTSKMNEEIRGYENLIEKLKQTIEGTTARKEVMDEISQKYGKYLDFIVDEATEVGKLENAYDGLVTSIRNYTAEKIREEQTQRLEKGMYDEYQDLEKTIQNISVFVGKGRTITPTREQAKNIASIIENALKENPDLRKNDVYEIIKKYFSAEGVFEDNIVDKQINKFIKKYRNLSRELQDIRKDIEQKTPVFETEADYNNYVKNREEAEAEIRKQQKESDEYIQKIIDEEKRAATEQWKIDDKIQKLRIFNEEQILKIKLQYGVITQEQYKKEMDRLHGVLDAYESDYNKRLEALYTKKYGPDFKTSSKEARDMYNWVVSTETALQQGTSQRNKQLIDTYKGLKESLKQYKEALKTALSSGASLAAIQLIQANIDTTILHMKAIEDAASLRGLDLSGKKNSGGSNYKSISTLISLLKEMNSEYDKLSKSAYGYAKSQEKVAEAYKDTFKEVFGFAGIDMESIDFTSKAGLSASMERVLNIMNSKGLWSKFGKDGGEKAKQEFMKAFSQMKAEVDIELSSRLRENFQKQMEDMFENYQLTIELKAMNIDESLAKSWLGTDYTSLGEILDAANEFADKQIEAAQAVGGDFDEEDLKAYKSAVDKIEKEILKERKEKTKEYSKYLEKELSERAKKEMEYAVKVAEVQGSQIFSEDQKNAILSNMEDEYNEAMQELSWKSFKESTFYVEMMDDLTSIPAEYSGMMLAKINEVLMNPKVVSPRVFKEAINAREKIMEAIRQMSPVAAMRSNRDLVDAAFSDESLGLTKKTTMGGKRRELQREIVDRTKNIDLLEKEAQQYDHLDAQLEAYEKAENNVNRALDQINLTLEGTTEESLQDEIDLRQQSIATLKEQEDRYKELLAIQGSGGLTKEEEEELKVLSRNVNIRDKSIADLESEIKLYETAKQMLSSFNAELGELNKPENADALALVNGEEVTTIGGTTVTKGTFRQNKEENKTQLKQQKNALQKLKEAEKGTREWVKAWHEFGKQMGEMMNKVKGMGDAFYDTYEALGGETNALTEGWKEFGDTLVDTITKALEMIPTLVTGFTAAGVAINSAMGIIGLIAEAIQLVLVLIGALAKLHDAGYEKKIQDQQKKIDDLKRAYERLEKSIEKTWETSSYIRTYNQEVQNLYERIEATNKQINAERAKKNADNDKIQDYKDSIQDMEDELEELKQTQIEVFGGIGREAYRDAASEFVDAWKSAFLETGDGLSGLQEHFDEFLQEWFVKQATMRVAGRMLEPLFSQIDKAVDQYSAGGANVLMDELNNIREQAGILLPQVSEALEQLAGSWGLEGQGSLSGLAAGIQGMTEEHANILEAYWNSVRGYTASIDMNVARIADILGVGGVNTNPLLAQMVLVANNTNGIHTLLQSVTTGGHGLGGYGIKVFAN